MRENRLSGSEGGGATSSPYPYQGFSLFRAAPASPLWTTNIRLRWSREQMECLGTTNIRLRWSWEQMECVGADI